MATDRSSTDGSGTDRSGADGISTDRGGTDGRGARRPDMFELLTRLRNAERGYDARVERYFGIGSTDLTAVRLIEMGVTAGRTVRAVDLATEIGLTTAAISLMLDRLVRAGYVHRAPDPSDRRGRILELTTTARQALADTDALAYAEVRRATSVLSQEGAAELTALIDDISGSLERRP